MAPLLLTLCLAAVTLCPQQKPPQDTVARRALAHTKALSQAFLQQPRPVMPLVRGQTEIAARKILAARRIRLDSVAQLQAVFAAGIPSGTVVRQYPDSGVAVSPSMRVVLYVVGPAAQPPPVQPPAQQPGIAVPALRGLTPAAARDTLLRRQLALGRTVELAAPAGTPAGIVVRQRPPANALAAPGTLVDIGVSAPAQPATTLVPPVVGLTRGEAAQRIASAGLQLLLGSEVPGLRPTGEVVGQRPRADTAVALGSAVIIDLAVRTRVLVPPLVGRDSAAAAAALRRVQLRLAGASRAASTRPRGRVVSQDPRPGTELALGSGVTVALSLGAGVAAAPPGGTPPDSAGRQPGREPPRPPSIPPWVYIVGLAALVAATGLVRRIRGRGHKADAPPPPTPRIEARAEAGRPAPVAEMLQEPRLHGSVRFLPHVDAGEAVVVAAVLAGESEEGA